MCYLRKYRLRNGKRCYKKDKRRAVGPSGMGRDEWRCILILGNFGNVREGFRKSIAEMSRKKNKLSCCLPSMQNNPI